jgi:hypothetical protein
VADLSLPISRVRADIEDHDRAADEFDVEPSDYVEVRRDDLETVLSAAEHHQSCHSGWLTLGPGGMTALREYAKGLDAKRGHR